MHNIKEENDKEDEVKDNSSCIQFGNTKGIGSS